VRIVRLIRLVRIVKLYKIAAGESDANLDKQVAMEPSQVGKKLTELTTRRVIILVLLMVIVLPFMDSSFLSDGEGNTYQSNGMYSMHHLPQDKNISACAAGACVAESTFKSIYQNFVRQAGKPFFIGICMEGCNTTWPLSVTNQWFLSTKFPADFNQPNTLYTDPVTGWNSSEWLHTEEEVLDLYRSNEASLTEQVGCYNVEGVKISDACISRAYFDLTTEQRTEAGLSILKTFFIMLILGAGSVMFTRDAERLVITPIERMVRMVKALAEDPLASTNPNRKQDDDEDGGERYETMILEDTLNKIGSLLQVGFGEAGAEIIGKNMQNGGEVDPMIPGKKVTAIFGFCDIRQFTDTTECLQGEVMTYVNKIAEIVHRCTHQYYGAANKNIGDAFLLAWKICDGDLEEAEELGDVQIQAHDTTGKTRVLSTTEMADSALTAFLKIIVELANANATGNLREYKDEPSIQRRWPADGPEGPFEIKMGFGMHIGWAIEGAIGSRYKIDASYLSPNVNMAARLEAATKQFRTPLLLSHWFVEKLSPQARWYCRRIDRVTVKGSLQPMTLYTYDVTEYPEVFQEPRYDKKTGARTAVNFGRDKSFMKIRKAVPLSFYRKFEEAMVAYIEGDWEQARSDLEDSLRIYPNDGPAEALMEVMGRSNFVSPEGWQGFRELTEK
jgi:class 3 adenylate cyclase